MASLDSLAVAICLLKAIFAWFVLGFVGTNLIGLVVRGLLWSPPVLDAPTDRVREILHRENRRMIFGNMAMTLLSIILTGAERGHPYRVLVKYKNTLPEPKYLRLCRVGASVGFCRLCSAARQ